MICQHCGLKNANRPRGLCWKCYHSDGVRELYRSSLVTTKYGHRGIGCGHVNVTPAATPTDAIPGTNAKLCVFASRVQLKQELHHPYDAQYPQEDARDRVYRISYLRGFTGDAPNNDYSSYED